MRDINRITKIMALIEEGWKKVPDWRLGQLIENLKRYIGVQDLFYIEDDSLEEKIKDFFDMDEENPKKDKVKIVLLQDEPDEDLKNKLSDESFPMNRTSKDLIKYIEEKGTFIAFQDEGSHYRLMNDYFFIQEIDTSRPWTIGEDSDGSEYVQYLDYKVINKDINYCKPNYNI